MDLKVYKKTRIQGVFQHIKNKNYAIQISKPYKTSISRINGEKIFDKELAKDIAANPTKYLNTPVDKEILIEFKEQNKGDIKEFDILWGKYMHWCKYIENHKYNTLIKKEKIYKGFLKNKIDKKISRTNKNFWEEFITSLDTTNKQKNEVLKQLKAFFNWWTDDESIIRYNPVAKIKKIKVKKTEMQFWTPEEEKKFIVTVANDLNSTNKKIRRKANLIYVLSNVTLATANRIGESRALYFDSFNNKEKNVTLNGSINYNRNDEDFVVDPKTIESIRINEVTERLIEIVQNYKKFLEMEYDICIDDHCLIFFNHITQKPYTDDILRKHFKYYCEKANVKVIRMYDMRHTTATNLVADKAPLPYVQKMLGHTNINTTVKNYVHARKDMKIATAQQADNYLKLT